ncbi:Membrane associated protein with extracellular Ig-like domain, a component of a putative secretion system [Halapricum desulfuricans]|uniref:Membrane associated protein with extracellular Ig-like domain, a component of a putative secretion system n=1 Tax=Halapricum desulfuricans TaxID=2841257 RepID=A0A897NKF3_9EURY|nr:DUF1616 domain-containing protein [Halapricum desulfuricans]QSG11349.1 Membrane associated protein with extracellular Ig-like domain, a component of a putative secretion system [Halapricum desulfuricans]
MKAGDGRSKGSVPYDLVLVVALALVVGVGASLPPVSDSPVRLVLAVVVVFLPGYSLIAVLFPRRRLASEEAPGSLAARARQLDGFDRLVLAGTVGLVVTPLLGIGLDFSPWSLREGPLLVALLGFVIVTSAIAAVRRFRLPPEERYAPSRRWVTFGTADPLSGSTVVTVAVVAAVVVAAGGVFVVASTDETGETFTEFLVLGTDGDRLVAGSYPTETVAGESVTVTLGIENQESREQSYTVVTQLQMVTREDGRTRVLGQETFEPVRLTVATEETLRHEHTLTPTQVGPNQRLVFLLYRGEPPATPTIDNAYRSTHLWVNVTSV